MQKEIEKLDHFGRGITKIDGKICFVFNALVGEIVKINIISEKKSYIEAEVKEYVKISNQRVKEICPYFKECGGCDLQHLAYQEENAWKEAKVKELIKRYSKIEKDVVKKIIFSEDSFYRNKITLHSKEKKLGYYKRKTKELLEIKTCPLASKKINDLFPVLESLVKKNNIEEIVVRISNQEDQKMVKLVGKITSYEELLPYVDVIQINQKMITKQTKMISNIGKNAFYVSMDSFLQVNKDLTEKLYEEVRSIVQRKRPKKVLDLYCGTGTIGIYICDLVEEVIGIDYLNSNIHDANLNKKLNHRENITFICDKVEQKINQFHDVNLVIVDPPRAGLTQKTKEGMQKIHPNTIIYISCDPVTLARDITWFQKDYEVAYVQPFNMFPRTYHVECVCLLNRRDS